MQELALTVDAVAEKHASAGTLRRTAAGSSRFTIVGVDAQVYIMPGRAVVEVAAEEPFAMLPQTLREQRAKYGSAFYASAGQLDDLLTRLGG